MIELKYPFDEKQIRALKAGDAVSITGPIHTGRDKFHKWFADGHPIEVDFRDGALYHCGPVIVPTTPPNPNAPQPKHPNTQTPASWEVKAAGPTTSVRENPYEPAFIAKSGVRIIIGKGGMDAATLAAMKKYGCVYVQAVGGAAAVAAKALQKVTGVSYLKEFGAAEACWHFDAVGFTGVVAMDAHGTSLFAKVAEASKQKLDEILAS